ncbi:MAG: hypothetical protein ACFFEN_15075 [Candidatus Thorarchaeota archaeon]
MDAARIFTVYVAQGILFAFFIFLAYKILKRDRKRLNIIFSLFYLSVAVGLLINFIYAPMEDVALESIVLILNFLTNFFISFSVVFLVVFELILLKSEKVVTFGKQLLVIVLYGVALFCMIFFLSIFTPGIGVTFPEGKPKWELPFFIYVVIVVTIGGIIPTLYLAFRISKKFEDEVLKKKWKFFIIGLVALFIFMYAIYISNYLNDDTIRLVMGGLGLILEIVGGYLIYYGVGRSIE